MRYWSPLCIDVLYVFMYCFYSKIAAGMRLDYDSVCNCACIDYHYYAMLIEIFLIICPFMSCANCTLLYCMQLLLLKRGGRTVYAGPLGEQSKLLVEYFQVCIVVKL